MTTPDLDPRSRLTLPNGGQVIPISAARNARRPGQVFDATAGRYVNVRELEASLEAYFNKQVRLMGGIADKIAPTRKGLPDRLVLLPGGRVYLVELKAYDGRVSAAQALYHERAAALGTRVQLLVGRDGVDAWLRKVAVQPGERREQTNPGRATGTRKTPEQ